jgi:hypothetical protein
VLSEFDGKDREKLAGGASRAGMLLTFTPAQRSPSKSWISTASTHRRCGGNPEVCLEISARSTTSTFKSVRAPSAGSLSLRSPGEELVSSATKTLETLIICVTLGKVHDKADSSL